jgi:hypothetical protein
MAGLEMRLLGPRSKGVLIADCCHDADFPNASERMRCNIGAVGGVAEVFGEQFFAPVSSCKPRLYRYLRNGESPNRLQLLSDS